MVPAMIPPASPAVPGAGSFPQLMSTRYTSAHGLPQGSVEAVRCSGKRTFVRCGGATYILDGEQWRAATQADQPPAFAVDCPAGLPAGIVVTSAARAANGVWHAATRKGPFRMGPDGWTPLELPRFYPIGQPQPNIDTKVRSVTADASGYLWMATDNGLFISDGTDWLMPIDRSDGMPYEAMTCVAHAPNGDVWGGTDVGAWRLRGGTWRYFAGPRWLPGDRVLDLAVSDTGAVWIATDHGVARIEERELTLEQKAAHYEDITQKRHSRGGWIAGCDLKVPGRPEEGHVHDASDNDGLWTAIYVAAEAYRFGVTKSKEARDHAAASMNALLDLVRLSGYPGYPARAIIRDGEVVTGYDANETVRVPGETDKIWYRSPTHRGILCKGDTSSDELDGHYFAWFVYHEMVATADEKREIARICAAVTDNLLDHGYTLVGHTGRKTRWGVFDPASLNEDPYWAEERGLNSLEMLCYLKVAHFLTGSKRYADAYETLISRHHYLGNVLLYRRGAPWYAVNHSDDELAYCVFIPLLQLEKAPERRAILLQSLATTWRGLQHEDRAWYNVSYGALTGLPARIDAAVRSLQDWPWELIHWQTRNSHRHDVTLRTAPGVRSVQTDRALPASEVRVMRWNGNPFVADGGGSGMSEEDGGAWLLAYWMGRYYGLIAK